MLLFFVSISCHPICAAQRKPLPPPPAPPPPVALSLRALRGENVDIPLRIHGTRNQTLEFRIRAGPRAGRLSEVKQSAQESASVTYTPPADLRVKEDRFSYAVRSKEGVSAAAEVVIEILDAPGALISPDVLEIAPAIIGTSVAAEIEIMNGGGSVVEGTIQTDPPWSLTEARTYRLRPKERQRFAIRFTPTEAGEFGGEVRYSSTPGRVTILRGQARPAIAITPGVVALRTDPASGARAAAFEVSNHTVQPQTLSFTASNRLILTRELLLPPGETSKVQVQMAANDLSAFSGEIHARTEHHSATVAVSAPAAPALLHAREPIVQFRDATANTAARADLEIENRGGSAANVTIHATPPFVSESSNVNMPPGSSKRVTIGLASAGPGTARGTLQLQWEAGRLDVPLEAKVAAGREAPSPPGRLPAVAAHPEIIKTALSTQDVTGVVPERILVQETTSTSATIEWPATYSSAPRFKAEERRLSPQEGALKIDWIEYPGFRTEKKGDRIVGTFTGLSPGRVYMMRIVPAVSGADDAAPLVDVQFRTRPAPSHRFTITPLRILAALLLVCIAAIIWSRIKERSG